MNDADLAEMLRHCPTLYHMAERGSWPGIQRHGLRSTTALLDLFQVSGQHREAIERRHRPACVTLRHPMHGTATVRDQKPMSDSALGRCLQDGLAPAEWYALLNGKVFFWLARPRLLKLLGGKAYREAQHDVLEVDAAALVEAYRDRIRLSAINSGATFALGPVARGQGTFQAIADYDYAGWRKRRPATGAVVELTVAYAVPDIARFVRRVVTMQDGETTGTLFQR